MRFLTESSGAITNTYAYNAYGSLIASNTPVANAYLYAGEQYDPDLGLYFLRARYFDPNSGRFWTMDSEEGDQESPKSLHRYTYCEGDPVDNIDPSGNEIEGLLAVMDIGDVLGGIYSRVATMVTARATVDVHFDRLNKVFGRKYHHAYLLLHGLGGLTFVFRGGPSHEYQGGGKSGAISDFSGLVPKGKDLGHGYLTEAGSGKPFIPGATDYPNGPNDDVAQVSVAVGSKSFIQLYQGFMRVADHIESLRLPYHPVRQNSNSFVKTLLLKNGLPARKPPVWTPGWNHVLY